MLAASLIGRRRRHSPGAASADRRLPRSRGLDLKRWLWNGFHRFARREFLESSFDLSRGIRAQIQPLSKAAIPVEIHDDFVLSRFKVQPLEGTSLRARVGCDRFDPEVHEPLFGLKAITYHQLYVRYDHDRYEAQVIVDI